MTNHSEATGSSGNSDITGRGGRTGPRAHEDRSAHDHGTACGRGASYDHEAPPAHKASPAHETEYEGETEYDREAAYEGHVPYGGRPAHSGGTLSHQVTLRTPAELADALPYLLGYRPEDSIVLVALHDQGGRGRFGGRARLGIPAHPEDWPAVARQLAQGLVAGSERRGTRPAQIVAYLCQEPAADETGDRVRERLQPLAHALRVECGRLDIPVIEALCISGGRFWSYCCSGEGCCPVEGVPMGLPGTSVLAAAATYAGIQVRGTLRELRARLLPLETGVAVEQELALDTAGMDLLPRMIRDTSRAAVAEETIALAARVMRRLSAAPSVTGALPADRRDDELVASDEAAALILGLQDRVTRDRAAEWMEGDEAAPALRLWRALARRCVGPYGEHAAAPLTLAGWVAWSSGDELEAREALAMALGADPGYLFARLLHHACNEGLDPESVRRCLRTEREAREQRVGGGTERPAETGAGAGAGPGARDGAVSGTGDRGRAAARAHAGTRARAGARAVRTGAESHESGAERTADGGAGRTDAASDADGTTGSAPVPGRSSSPSVGRRRRRARSAGPVGSPARTTAATAGERGAKVPGARAAGSTRPTASGPTGTRSRTRTSGEAAALRRSGCVDGDTDGGESDGQR
ncbi:DUF4192 domain-containing protein [Streptomyces sp. NPDC014882]|uniref:DUF4192 domain-containing protein n=1 Tax=Streptomyces sp. NPDC014882 TaxID=3364927 RepID=UPI0036F89573